MVHLNREALLVLMVLGLALNTATIAMCWRLFRKGNRVKAWKDMKTPTERALFLTGAGLLAVMVALWLVPSYFDATSPTEPLTQLLLPTSISAFFIALALFHSPKSKSNGNGAP